MTPLSPVVAWLLAAALALLGGVAGLFCWSDGLATLGDDSVSYLLMGRCWSPWLPPAEAQRLACAYESYPPLFPALLALSGAVHRLEAAHLLVVGCFLAAVGLLFAWARRVTGSLALALSTTALFAAAPLTWLQMRGILSENLFLAFTLAALWWWESRAGRWCGRERWWLGILLALGLLTRTIGVAVVAAFGLALLQGVRPWRPPTPAWQRLRPWLAPLAIPLLLALGWYLLHPPGGQSAVRPYWEDLAQVAASLGGETVAEAPPLLLPQAEGLVLGWISAHILFWSSETQPNLWLAAAWGGLALAGGWRRWRGHHPDGWLVPLTTVILLLWPYPGQMPRFLYGLLPILLLHGAVGAAWLGEALRRWLTFTPAQFAAGVVAALLSVVLTADVFILLRAQPNQEIMEGVDLSRSVLFLRTPDANQAQERAMLEEMVQQDFPRLKESIAPHQKVLWFAPNYIALLAERQGVPFPWLQERAGFLRAVWDSGADYIYLTRYHPRNTVESFNGLAWQKRCQEFTELEWLTPSPLLDGLLAVLLRVDRTKLAGLIADRQ